MKKYLAAGISGALALAVAIPAFAATDKAMMKSSKAAVTVDTACMQAAIDKRETALIAGVDVYSASVKTALTVRKDALKAAWAITDKTARNTAIKAAWTAFQGTWKNASAAMKTVKKSAWAAFNTDAKACKQTGADSAGASVDANL